MPGGFPGGMPGGFPGGMPGAGRGAGGKPAGMPDISGLFSDPDFQDPEVQAAFQDVISNPANISKYKNNPKVQRVIQRMTSQFGGGAGGGMADMFGGAPEAEPPSSGAAAEDKPKPPSGDGLGLD